MNTITRGLFAVGFAVASAAQAMPADETRSAAVEDGQDIVVTGRASPAPLKNVFGVAVGDPRRAIGTMSFAF